MSIYRALIAADIDPDAITRSPTSGYTVTAPDGDRFCVDEDGVDYWIGTRYNANDEEEGFSEWDTPAEMAKDVAAWMERRSTP